MDIRQIRNAIIHNHNLYIPSMDKEVKLKKVKEENGRKWGIGVTEDGKEVRVDIRFIEPAEGIILLNDNTPFPEDKREELEKREETVFEALRLLGRNRAYIRQALKDEMETAMNKTMMAKVTHSNKRPFKDSEVSGATVRAMHYANTGLVARKIAEGLFPGDKELAMGIAICALYHDYGQCPFGHDGETSCRHASESNNGGPVLHNSEGARRLKHREYNKLKDAINKGKIIEDEAKKRVREDSNYNKDEFDNQVKAKIKELEENIKLGLEPELDNKIKENIRRNGDLTDEAIKLIITSAGNHNGERGIPKIVHNYSLTFDDFWKRIQETYIDEKTPLEPGTISDAISKVADQISSIPFDMIDGVRSGIEDEVPDEWVPAIVQILRISEDEAKNRLKGNEEQLKTLAHELQDRLIDSVVCCSNQRELNMDLADWLYGLNGQASLRKPNMEHHIRFTSTQKEENLLDNLIVDVVDELSKAVLDEKGAFTPSLNDIFRIRQDNPIRQYKENNLKRAYTGKEELRDFYNYCTEISSEEYDFYKQIAKKQELKYFKDIIVAAVKSYNDKGGYDFLWNQRRGTMEYAIGSAIESGNIEVIQPDENGNYSDEQIKTMIENINANLRMNPIDGIRNLDVTTSKKHYDINKKNSYSVEERTESRDQQIAAKFAISYIMTLTDQQLLTLANNLGIIKEEEMEEFYKPYSIYSEKRTGGSGNMTASAIKTTEDYIEAINELNELGEK